MQDVTYGRPDEKGIGGDDEDYRGHIREGHRERRAVAARASEVEPDTRRARVEAVQLREDRRYQDHDQSTDENGEGRRRPGGVGED